jgi:hypothetical protein
MGVFIPSSIAPKHLLNLNGVVRHIFLVEDDAIEPFDLWIEVEHSRDLFQCRLGIRTDRRAASLAAFRRCSTSTSRSLRKVSMWIPAILTSGRVRPRIATRQAEVNHTLRGSVSDRIGPIRSIILCPALRG